MSGGSVVEQGTVARIGPNAVIQTVNALRAHYPEERVVALLNYAGRADLLSQFPAEMIDEREFHDLAHALRAQLGIAETGQILGEAGTRTGDYVIANRIPAPARFILRLLPRPLALRVLLPAIRQHAWTFVGSGIFSYSLGRPLRLRIVGCVECREEQALAPMCSFYRSAFERLLGRLVDRRARVQEIACAARGDGLCEFEVRFV